MVMSGSNVLEVPYFHDDRVRVQDKVPVPAVLDYQLDYMAIQYMLKEMKRVVKRLKSLIFDKGKTRNWYEVYLTSFVLLSSLEVVQAHQLEMLRLFEEMVGILLH
jgi:hypothetical protein